MHTRSCSLLMTNQKKPSPHIARHPDQSPRFSTPKHMNPLTLHALTTYPILRTGGSALSKSIIILFFNPESILGRYGLVAAYVLHALQLGTI